MKKGKLTKIQKRESHAFWLFILPWFVGFIALTLWPMLYSLYASFTTWDGISAPVFKGIHNFVKMFTEDDLFFTSIKNTIIYTIATVPINLAVSLFLANLLNRQVPGRTLFRSLIYLPSVCAGVAIYIVWSNLFNDQQGFINYFLSILGIKGPSWLVSTKWAMPALIIMNITFCGTSMLIFLAGLQDIPEMLYDAAKVDGASRFQRFYKITLPLITPVLFCNLIMSMISSLQIFTQPAVMTGGGPVDATYVYGMHLYNNAFKYFDFSYSCSLSWILFIVIMILSLIVMKTSKSWVYTEGE